MLEFDIAWSHFDVAWGHFDVAWQKLWHKNDVFDEILGCAGHLKLPKKKWAPVAVKIFYKYGVQKSLFGILPLLVLGPIWIVPGAKRFCYVNLT